MMSIDTFTRKTMRLASLAAAVALFAVFNAASLQAAPLVLDVPGYKAVSIQVATPPSQNEGPALTTHPTEPWAYVAVDMTGEGFNDHQVWKLDFSTDPPTVSVISAGAYRSDLGTGVGDDVLDSLFGSIGGLAVLGDGSLLIVDNNVDSEGRGDTIYIARDLNSDGDARDVVEVEGIPTSETLILIEPIATNPGSGRGGFSGVQAAVDADGHAYIVTADGLGEGEVLRIENPAGPAPSISVYYPGLDYGSGLAFDSTGRLYVGSVDFNFIDYTTTATIHRLHDANANGAIDEGEAEIVSYGQMPGLFDIAVAPDDRVFVTSNWEVRILNPEDGTSTVFAHAADWTFLGDLAFLGTGSFEPFSGPGGAILLVAVPNSDGTITAILPDTAASVTDWTLLR